MKPLGGQFQSKQGRAGFTEVGSSLPITIIDDEKRRLVFYRESKVVHHTIKAPLHGNDFRDLLSRGADCLERNNAAKWLSDDRANEPLSTDDNAWADSIWVPRVMRAGFKYWAIVVPKSATGSLQMRRLSNEFSDRGVEVKVLSTLESAMTWLKSVDQTG